MGQIIKTSAILFLCLFTAALLEAMPGKVILMNGNTLKGDINKRPDGSCMVALSMGVVKFEKNEIKRIIIYSTEDTLSKSFKQALRQTPESRPAPSSAGKATPYEDIIHRSAKKHKVDPALVKAVMKAESNFNPDDVSRKGACGLMQLMPETARGLGVKDIFSPHENVSAGTQYLSYMLDEFNGDMEKALAAYNAGPAAVKKYKSVPPYLETMNYVKNVSAYYRYFKNAREGNVLSYTDSKGCLNIYNAR